MKISLSSYMASNVFDTGGSPSPARWSAELADKYVSWETCIATSFELLDIPEEDRDACLSRLKSKLQLVRSVNDEAKATDTLLKWFSILKRKKISFFEAETTTRPLSLLERSTTGREWATDAQNRY
jgi:hypothetical protein